VPHLRDVLSSGKFVITSEVAPPKGTELGKTLHHIDLLKDKVDALNVTDHQSSVMRFPSIGGCLLIKEHGGEPVLQMTCRDRNRLALQRSFCWPTLGNRKRTLPHRDAVLSGTTRGEGRIRP